MIIARKERSIKKPNDPVSVVRKIKRKTRREIVVEAEGGFHGACEMLITLGAWALIPNTNKPIRFEFREVLCPNNK